MGSISLIKGLDRRKKKKYTVCCKRGNKGAGGKI